MKIITKNDGENDTIEMVFSRTPPESRVRPLTEALRARGLEIAKSRVGDTIIWVCALPYGSIVTDTFRREVHETARSLGVV